MLTLTVLILIQTLYILNMWHVAGQNRSNKIKWKSNVVKSVKKETDGK